MSVARSLIVTLAFFFGVGQAALAQVPVDERARDLNFDSAFLPSDAPFGGFGGCAGSARRTPVIFVHGNGDFAGNWNAAASGGGLSVLEEFKAAGYTDCEIFGVSFLSEAERAASSMNYHNVEKADILSGFIRDVLNHTGHSQVDIVSHSLGVTMSLYAIDQAELWPNIRRFVGIAGAMRGLNSCATAGPANPFAKTCAAEGPKGLSFGFWPHGLGGGHNPRTGVGEKGFAQLPKGVSTVFHTIRAGTHDQIVCRGFYKRSSCELTSMFEPSENVVSQVHVGSGKLAPLTSADPSSWSVLTAGGDDDEGVGHMRAKTDTGRIQLNMLTTDCQGVQCCEGYSKECKE